LTSSASGESSETVRRRVNAAREIACERFRDAGIVKNADLSGSLIRERGNLTPEAAKVIEDSFKKMNMSARAYDRILRVARTIADLDGSETIRDYHVHEALQYRMADKKYFGRKF
ncbi:MAG: hypothetical protein IJO52_06505, partial [Clostridia bacterium]|nr:hypothetical protein [Clostridia bacterium]